MQRTSPTALLLPRYRTLFQVAHHRHHHHAVISSTSRRSGCLHSPSLAASVPTRNSFSSQRRQHLQCPYTTEAQPQDPGKNATTTATTPTATTTTAAQTGAKQEGPDSSRITELEQKLALAEAKATEEKNKYLRALAETENVRTRLERDIASTKTYAIQKFSLDLLTTADTLGMALKSVKADALGANEELKQLFKGLELTDKELKATLGRFGVTGFEPSVGDRFDPNFHQAMFEVEEGGSEGAKGVEEGGVVGVMKRGYMIGERVLRAAEVGVAKKKK